jgi:hypothetical protein
MPLALGLGGAVGVQFGIPLAVLSLALLAYGAPGNCPRCGKTFARKGAYHNQFTTRCLNCGIRIGESKDAPGPPFGDAL